MRGKKGQGEWIAGIVVLAIFIAVVGLFILFLSFDMVDANHLGVKVKLGEITGVQDAGLKHTGMFTQVNQYDLRTRKAVIELAGGDSAVDSGGQAIYATINVNYRVKPTHETVTELYKNIGKDNIIADRLNIDAIVTEGFKQATVKFEALEIIERRQEVKELAKENIRSNFPSQYFEIENIIITNIDFSQGFKDAIDRKKIAEQTALEEENNLQVVIFQQQQKIEEAKAESERIRLQSEALTELTVQKAWIEAWDGKLPMYMMTTSDNVDFLMQLPDGD